MDFSETIVVYNIKVGRFSQLNEYMNLYDINGQGHSLNFVQGHSDSTFSNFFCSDTARPIEAKFHMGIGCGGMKNLICSNVPSRMTMPIYGEKLQKSSSSEPRGR